MKRPTQQGSVLISVIVALVVLAAVSRMLTLQQSERVELLSMEDNRQTADYLAEAGLRDALWRAKQLTNSQYPATVNGSLPGQGTYSATITPTSGSPITVVSTGTTSTGMVAQVTRAYDIACIGKTVTTAVITSYDSKGPPENILQSSTGTTSAGYLMIDNSPSTANSARVLITFSLGSLPKGVAFDSAELVLDVQQHDAAMEGGTLFVNRLTKAYDFSRATWTNATSNTDKWTTPGGDYTLVDEARTAISASASTYTWTITPIVYAWVNGSLVNNGLVIRTDLPSSAASHKLRLKKNVGSWPTTQWPRLVVKYCA